MSASSAALLVLQDSLLAEIIQTIIYLPVIILFGIVDNLKEVFGCNVSFEILILFLAYGVYHAVVFSLMQAVMMWVSTAAGMYLLAFSCAFDYGDVAMIATQVELLRELKGRL